MILTLKFALHHNSANSQAIGYFATQQNAPYNGAFDVINREPNLPRRSNRNTSDAINMLTTARRQAIRHQEGGEQAWEAYQRPQQSRSERSELVVRAIANGEEPKQRDVRPHRRTLAYRTRKKTAGCILVQQVITVIGAVCPTRVGLYGPLLKWTSLTYKPPFTDRMCKPMFKAAALGLGIDGTLDFLLRIGLRPSGTAVPA